MAKRGRPPALGLTPRQYQALKAIEKFVAENGFAPTHREIGLMLNCSPSQGAKLARGLEVRGRADHRFNFPRSIVLVNRAA